MSSGSSITAELLAPAGNRECLHAAVRAGADAVYLGADSFNARRGADNFSPEALREACDYAHLRGVRIYLTVNTAILPSEFPRALELVRQAYRVGVDAFIVQDIGLASRMATDIPHARIHISTQMNTHNAAGIQAAANFGAKRITLARELSLPQITRLSKIAEDFDMEVECFAHGALCVCYSGQCLMSSLIGGRSANRGMCAQACRLPYELFNKAQRKPLEAPGEHLLSPKDLCSIDMLPSLLDAGVASFKIEGRMKSPEYVSAVVGAYRAVLDRALAGDAQATATEKEMQAVNEAFSRGFTTAYLTGQTDGSMMGYARPNNRGVNVGRIADAKGSTVTITATQPIIEGDILEVWTGKGHVSVPVENIITQRDNRLSLRTNKRVGKGDRVFRVRSAAAAYADSDQLPSVPITGFVRLRRGKPLLMGFTSLDGQVVQEEGSVVEAARTKAITQEEVHEHIARFGGTPFSLDQLDIDMDDSVGLGFSTLHKMRARLAQQLQDQMLEQYHDRTLDPAPKHKAPKRQVVRECDVVVLATNPACARAAKRAGAQTIFVPALNFKRGQAVVAGQQSGTVEQAGYPKQALVALPTIDQDFQEGSRELKFGFNAWEYVKPSAMVLADNLGDVVHATSQGIPVAVGHHVPVLNPQAAQYLGTLGVERIWLSPELALGQIDAIAEQSPVPLGLCVSGSAELMITEHCLLQSQGPCAQNCPDCARRKSPHYLKDRKGYQMTVATDCCGRSHIYNAVPLDIVHMMPDLIRAGISAVMVDTTLMNVEETTDAVKRAVRARDIAQKSGDAVSKSTGTTTGHIFRGVS